MAVFVKANPGESSDSLMKRFQRKIVAEKIIPEMRDREYFKKASELKKEYLAEKRRKIMRYRRYGG